ncbi:MAG TPA: hypothetical protein VNV38_07495 [Stellaceae bacterium]|jgi:hypothetical protein|nr:hypothetical protein [Stellaceae bacterium]
MRSQRNGVAEAAEQAQSVIADTVGTVRDAAADVTTRAGEYSREAGRQASAAAQTAYEVGGNVLGTVEGFTRENVWGSLLLAAAVGYGLACLVKNTRGV